MGNEKKLYWGDLHAHCGISYGMGSLENSLANAREHLDFVSVVGHALWHDMMQDRQRYGREIDYHGQAFARLAGNWPTVQKTLRQACEAGRFIPILGYEWHSKAYGDYNVYYPHHHGEITPGNSPRELEGALCGTGAIMIPHHTAYAPRERSIDWDMFPLACAPVVEIFSSHGCGEADDAPRPYLHTMGPRDYRTTARSGLEKGLQFGFVASTDNHAGFPGSYNNGKVGIYADALTHAGLWEGLRARRTCAVTGDAMRMELFVNDTFIGGTAARAEGARLVHGKVEGLDLIKEVEIIKNGRILKVLNNPRTPAKGGVYKIRLEWGWGNAFKQFRWDGHVAVKDGSIVGLDKCFGAEKAFVAPRNEGEMEEAIFVPHQVTQSTPEEVRFLSHTDSNPHMTVSFTNALVLTIAGDENTEVAVTMNSVSVRKSIRELLQGSLAFFASRWLDPAFCLHRALPPADHSYAFEFTDGRERERDYYYLRVRQENGQYGWTSPVWA